MVTKYIIKKK